MVILVILVYHRVWVLQNLPEIRLCVDPCIAIWPRIVEMYEWDETHCWRRIRILAIREAAEGGGMQALLMCRGRPECFYLNFLQEWLMKFINTSLSFGQTGEGEVTIDFFFGSDVL
jgi:hypothetical protein